MARIDDFDHDTGRDCGAAAIRDLLAHYEWAEPTTASPSDWDLDEAAVFALGAGLGAVAYGDDRPWTRFCGRTPWFESNALEALDVQHLDAAGDDFGTAWGDVTDRLDDGTPVLLFLDPADLPYAVGRTHQLPHVVTAVGHDGDALTVADPSAAEPVSLSRDRLRSAWSVAAPFDATHRHLAVQDAAIGVDRETAASRAIRRATGYALDQPTHDDRGWGAVGTHGPAAIRAFADDVAGWPDLDEDAQDAAIAAACRAVAGEADGAAHRRLYAEGLSVVAPAAGLGAAWADRAGDLADAWAAVGDEFVAARDATGTERAEHLETAASAVAAVADDEEGFFADLREALRD